jgi:hypothetical protein
MILQLLQKIWMKETLQGTSLAKFVILDGFSLKVEMTIGFLPPILQNGLFGSIHE